MGIALSLLGLFIVHRIRKRRANQQLQQEMSHQQAAGAGQQTYAGFAGPSGVEAQPTEQ